MTPAELLDGIDRLGSLPEAVVRVNQLIDSPGASLAEISEALGRTPQAVAGLLKRGLAQLRDQMPGNEGGVR